MIIRSFSMYLLIFIAMICAICAVPLYSSSELSSDRYHLIKNSLDIKSFCDLEMFIIKNKESNNFWLKQRAESIIGCASFGMGTFFATCNSYIASLPFISLGVYLVASQKKEDTFQRILQFYIQAPWQNQSNQEELRFSSLVYNLKRKLCKNNLYKGHSLIKGCEETALGQKIENYLTQFIALDMFKKDYISQVIKLHKDKPHMLFLGALIKINPVYVYNMALIDVKHYKKTNQYKTCNESFMDLHKISYYEIYERIYEEPILMESEGNEQRYKSIFFNQTFLSKNYINNIHIRAARFHTINDFGHKNKKDAQDALWNSIEQKVLKLYRQCQWSYIARRPFTSLTLLLGSFATAYKLSTLH